MNDVFTTLAVITIIVWWVVSALVWALFHFDAGMTKSWWIGQIVLLTITLTGIYAVVRWAVTT